MPQPAFGLQAVHCPIVAALSVAKADQWAWVNMWRMAMKTRVGRAKTMQEIYKPLQF